MNTVLNCNDCGAAIPLDAPNGMCPHCLARAALGTEHPTVRGASPNKTISLDISAVVEISPTIHYFGDYELLSEIARGGMGVVYKARQTSLNRIVAVKMILSGQLAGETEVKRFRTEAEAAGNLQHPNIVAIHEVGEHEGRQYFSMDYVEGKNLAEVIQGKPMAAREAAALLKTIAEAVHHAHQRGTLHRDLKPQNVLIDAEGRPRITDFGLAKKVDQDSELTRTGAVMGSPAYMPPEQATGRHDQLGPASDVYSVGAILYQLLTGMAPYLGATPLDTLRLVVEQEPLAPSKLNSDVPPDLETICLKCLEKSPERRYASARALAEELERFLKQEPILARPASGWRKAWTWSARNPWAITGVGTLLFLGVVGLAYGQWEQLRYLEWQRTHTTPRPAASAAWGFLQMLLFVAGLVAAFHASCLTYMRRRKGLPVSRVQVALGWIAGLSWICFGLGLLRLVILENSGGEHSGWRLAFQASISLIFAWAGALYFWHVLKSQQVALFGSNRKTARRSLRTEVLNKKTQKVMAWINFILFGLLAWLAIPDGSQHHILSARPEFNLSMIRAQFVQLAFLIWICALQSRGLQFASSPDQNPEWWF